MRTFMLAVVFAASAVAAMAFPPPLTPEQPVSQRLTGPAAGDQETLAVASNGQISFAVWLDLRGGPMQWNRLYDLYGSRIDPAGLSLDPLGIRIASDVIGGTVIWNGTAFVVVSEDEGAGKLFTFITPDGAQVGQKVVQIPGGIAASMGSGPDARILFLGGGPTYGTSSTTVVDAIGNVTGTENQSPALSDAIAFGSNKSEFLVLLSTSNSNRIDATRLDRGGKVISTARTGIDPRIIGYGASLAGSDYGYLLTQASVCIYLDLNGVQTGSPMRLDPPASSLYSFYPGPNSAVMLDGDTYIAAWTTTMSDRSAYATVARFPVAGVGSGPPVVTHPLHWSGVGHDAVLGLAGTRTLLIVDAFRAGISTTIDPIARVLDAFFDETPLPDALSSSVTRQVDPQVASSTNGYAVVWNEYGPDGANHLYLRRFSSTGVAADPAPIEVARDSGGQAITARIAAAGGTYVVAWSTPDPPSDTNYFLYGASNYFLRRLSAATGTWMDADPVPFAPDASEMTLGASGSNVLAVYNVACAQGCLRARAIAIDSGMALRTAETSLAATVASEVSVGSNGTDFLVGWTDNPCGPNCDVLSEFNLFVERVGADGTLLDSKPLALNQQFAQFPSIAWAGTSYVVTFAAGTNWIWVSRVAGAGALAVTQKAAFTVGNDDLLAQRLVATGSGLLLFTAGPTATQGTTLDAESLVPSGTPFTIENDPRYTQVLSAAPLPNGVVVAYDRVGDDTGNVERVFNRVFVDTPRHRAAR